MFCWSLAYGIYYMVTYHTRKHCYICDETDGDFSRWKQWALHQNRHTLSASSLSSYPCLYQCLRIGFTIYLATSSWGADLINQEECHCLVGATTPKDDGSEELSASSKMNLVAQIIVNLCIHYVCPIANTALYFAYHTRKAPWNPARPVGFILILSVVVVIAQEVGGLVIYCTNSIYLTALYAILFVTACHALFFFQREGKCNDPMDTLDLDEEEAEVETTSSTETLA
eukprot:scaffold2051_cov139-Skeletonema_marinoi.AAC.14